MGHYYFSSVFKVENKGHGNGNTRAYRFRDLLQYVMHLTIRPTVFLPPHSSLPQYVMHVVHLT